MHPSGGALGAPARGGRGDWLWILQEVMGDGVGLTQLMPPETLALPGCPRLASVWREGLARCPAWVAPEESETQHKLWPRLPLLCQQDLRLRTSRSWVPSDREGVFHLG